MTFGDRIKIIRGGLSQEEFAAFLGVHRNTVNNWESNKGIPNKVIITQFHEDLNVNLNWLFSSEGEPFLDKQGGAEEIFKLAMDCMGVAVTIIDPNGTMLYYNQSGRDGMKKGISFILACDRSH